MAITECSICRSTKDLNPKDYGDCAQKRLMVEHHACFICAHWMNLIETNKNNPYWFIINGSSWIAAEPRVDVPNNFLGCAGRVQKVITKDGRSIISNNWWHQGNIPEKFLEGIPESHFATWDV